MTVTLPAADPTLQRVRHLAGWGDYRLPEGAGFFQGMRCARCGGRGYLGSVDLFEVLEWDGALTDALLQGAPAEELTRVAVEQGGGTLPYWRRASARRSRG